MNANGEQAHLMAEMEIEELRELVATLRGNGAAASANTSFRYGLRVGQTLPRGPAEIEREWCDTSDGGTTRSQRLRNMALNSTT